MFETWIDVVRFTVAGATGGLIYWAAREHGQIFADLWAFITTRRRT
jgi:hypothetical protein